MNRLNFKRVLPPVVPQGSVNDDDAIVAEYLRHNPVRQFEPGATMNSYELTRWLSQVCGYRVHRHSITGGYAKLFSIDGRRCGLERLFEVVDIERIKRGLLPLKSRTLRWRSAHGVATLEGRG